MKLIIIAAVLLSIFFINIPITHMEAIPVHSSDKDPTPPDPNRPYYDGHGNKYDYNGNLIEVAPDSLPDPVYTPFVGK